MASTSKTGKSSKKTVSGLKEAQQGLAAVEALAAEERFSALSSLLLEVAACGHGLEGQLAAAEQKGSGLRADTARALLSQGQLEARCRDLQRANRRAVEESTALVREEQQKREDVSSRLDATLQDINSLMRQNQDKNTLITEDNRRMSAQLLELTEQYDQRKKHMDALVKQRQLQLQLSEARLAKARLEESQEKEVWLREKRKLIKTAQGYQTRLSQLTDSEETLRDQLAKFGSQYGQFSNTVQQSNEIMDKFKAEIAAMSEKAKRLEKQCLQWQQKWQQSNNTLLLLVAERADYVMKSERLNKQNRELQRISRLVQSKRQSCRGVVSKAAAEAKQKETKSCELNKLVECENKKNGCPASEESSEAQMSSIEARLEALKTSVAHAGEAQANCDVTQL